MPADGLSRPSFTPTAARPAAPSPAATEPRTGSPFGTSPFSSTSQSSASGTSGASGSAYSAPQAYTAPAANTAPPGHAQPNYSRSAWPGGQDTAGSVGTAAPNGTQGAPSDSGFSSTAAAAAAGLTGAAAGLAGAVSGFWRRRSELKAGKGRQGPTVRRSNKRQAMLTLSRVEPWSVMKFSFVASVVAFIILFVAVAVLYMVLSALGVFDSLQNQVSSITSSQNTAGTNISHWFSASLILGYTAMLGALNIVLITALSTIGSVIYNLIAKTVGGIEVTLRETD
jgi:hypothetical protein